MHGAFCSIPRAQVTAAITRITFTGVHHRDRPAREPTGPPTLSLRVATTPSSWVGWTCPSSSTGGVTGRCSRSPAADGLPGCLDLAAEGARVVGGIGRVGRAVVGV